MDVPMFVLVTDAPKRRQYGARCENCSFPPKYYWLNGGLPFSRQEKHADCGRQWEFPTLLKHVVFADPSWPRNPHKKVNSDGVSQKRKCESSDDYHAAKRPLKTPTKHAETEKGQLWIKHINIGDFDAENIQVTVRNNSIIIEGHREISIGKDDYECNQLRKEILVPQDLDLSTLSVTFQADHSLTLKANKKKPPVRDRQSAEQNIVDIIKTLFGQYGTNAPVHEKMTENIETPKKADSDLSDAGATETDVNKKNKVKDGDADDDVIAKDDCNSDSGKPTTQHSHSCAEINDKEETAEKEDRHSANSDGTKVKDCVADDDVSAKDDCNRDSGKPTTQHSHSCAKINDKEETAEKEDGHSANSDAVSEIDGDDQMREYNTIAQTKSPCEKQSTEKENEHNETETSVAVTQAGSHQKVSKNDRQDARHFEISVPLPHYKPTEIQVKISGNKLTLCAKHREEKSDHIIQHELFRSFPLPPEVDPEMLTARLDEKGNLTIFCREDGHDRTEEKTIPVQS